MRVSSMISREKFGNPIQPVTNAMELYLQAIGTVDEYSDRMNDFLDRLREEHPGKFQGVEFICANIKKPTRYKNKVDGDYDGHAERSVDIVRGTFVCEVDDEIFEIQDALAEEFDILRTKDNFVKPSRTGFRNFNNSIPMSNGHITEVQVMYAGTWTVKKITHDLMKQAQEIERKAERSINDAIMMNSLVKAARLVNNSAVASMKTEHLINPEWTDGQMTRFTRTESNDPLFRRIFAAHGELLCPDNDDFIQENDADSDPEPSTGDLENT